MAKPTLHFQRFEFKYFLPKSYARPLIAALRPHMAADPYMSQTGKGYYRVNSLYFDTHDFACFWDKEAGVADRKKLRLRYYGEALGPESDVYAEIKRKKDALVIKDRVMMKSADTAGSSFRQKLRQLYKANPEREFNEELYWFTKRNSLRPKLFISYARTALLAKRNKEFRVTVDEDIIARRQSLLGERISRTEKIYPDGVVVEVKYQNVLPAWFHGVLQKFELERLAFSKYGNAIRRLIPNFDDNNYKPV